MKVDMFTRSTTGKKLIWNTGFQIVGRAISALTTLGITILIARAFGTSGYGDFVKITTFVAFFYLLADFGFNAIFLQRSPLLPGDASKHVDDTHWNELLGLRIFVSVLLIGIAIVILACIPEGVGQGYTQIVRMGIILFVPTILFQALTTTANALFQKHLRYDAATVAVGVGSVVSLILIWITTQYYREASVVMSITSLLVGSAVTALASLWIAKKFLRTMNISLSPSRLRSLFLASAPLGLTLLFNLIYFHIDSVILTLTRSTAEVGIYGLVYKIFELPLVLPTFFMNALYPVMLGYMNPQSREISSEFKKLLSRSFLYMFIASCVTVVCVWFAAPLVSLIKTDFLPGVPALRVLALGLPFFFLSSLTMWILITTKNQKKLVYIYGISMCMNIVLNILFTPTYGYIAAAWITVVSEALVLLLSGGVVLKILTVK